MERDWILNICDMELEQTQSLFPRRALLYYYRYFISPKANGLLATGIIMKNKIHATCKVKKYINTENNKEDILLKWSSDNFHRQSDKVSGQQVHCYGVHHLHSECAGLNISETLSLFFFFTQKPGSKIDTVDEPLIAADSSSWLTTGCRLLLL